MTKASLHPVLVIMRSPTPADASMDPRTEWARTTSIREWLQGGFVSLYGRPSGFRTRNAIASRDSHFGTYICEGGDKPQIRAANAKSKTCWLAQYNDRRKSFSASHFLDLFVAGRSAHHPAKWDVGVDILSPHVSSLLGSPAFEISEIQSAEGSIAIAASVDLKPSDHLHPFMIRNSWAKTSHEILSVINDFGTFFAAYARIHNWDKRYIIKDTILL